VEGTEHHCKIWTDHKNHQYFMMAKKLNQRQARWSLLLAHFDFIMHHRPRKSMGKTNDLSRCSDHGTGSEDNDNMVVRGRSTSSDVSSDISPSPLYIPPHRRQSKTECTRGSDTGVR